MIAVFAYHSVSDIDYIYAISPADFEQQLAYIKENFKITSLSEFEALLKAGQMPKQNMALITFDDGLKDNYKYAFPILKKLGIPATIFLTAGSVGGSFQTRAGELEALDWREVKDMHESKIITFANHTHSHPDLTLVSESHLDDEFNTSSSLIQNNLGFRPTALAYPKGKFNLSVQRTAEKYFFLAFGNIGVILDAKNIDMFAIPRIIISTLIPRWKFKLFKFPLYWQLKSIFGTK